MQAHLRHGPNLALLCALGQRRQAWAHLSTCKPRVAQAVPFSGLVPSAGSSKPVASQLLVSPLRSSSKGCMQHSLQGVLARSKFESARESGWDGAGRGTRPPAQLAARAPASPTGIPSQSRGVCGLEPALEGEGEKTGLVVGCRGDAGCLLETGGYQGTAGGGRMARGAQRGREKGPGRPFFWLMSVQLGDPNSAQLPTAWASPQSLDNTSR